MWAPRRGLWHVSVCHGEQIRTPIFLKTCRSVEQVLCFGRLRRVSISPCEIPKTLHEGVPWGKSCSLDFHMGYWVEMTPKILCLLKEICHGWIIQSCCKQRAAVSVQQSRSTIHWNVSVDIGSRRDVWKWSGISQRANSPEWRKPEKIGEQAMLCRQPKDSRTKTYPRLFQTPRRHSCREDSLSMLRKLLIFFSPILQGLYWERRIMSKMDIFDEPTLQMKHYLAQS